MAARTGAEYIAGLRQCPPHIHMQGQRVTDPTIHPGLQNGVQTLARLYDMQHDSSWREAMTYEMAPVLSHYLETDTASARDRVRLFRLAWDTCCSAFASRQVLYERFFQGDRSRNVILLHTLYDKAPMRTRVQEFLQEG